MRKNLGSKPYLLPMPVLVIGTYNEDESANAMNVAYASLRDEKTISLYISRSHKTTDNILRTQAFTVGFADLMHLPDADYVGCVSGNTVTDKVDRTGLDPIPSEFVDAPVFDALPISLDCSLLSYDEEDDRVVGKIENVSIDTAYLGEKDAPDTTSMDLLLYNSAENTYQLLGDTVGTPFRGDENLNLMGYGAEENVQEEEPSKENLAKNLPERIARVKAMEKKMNGLQEAQDKLNAALDAFEAYGDESDAFDAYYSSSDWMEDYDADNLGLFPDDLDRGVLNEDIPYDVLGGNYELGRRLQKLARKLLGRSH